MAQEQPDPLYKDMEEVVVRNLVEHINKVAAAAAQEAQVEIQLLLHPDLPVMAA